MQKLKFLLKNTSLIIITIVIFLIFLGGLIFRLPFFYNEGLEISFIDSLFISSSTICSLGITPFEIENFSKIGKIFFLIWVQIGGVGIPTILIVISNLFAKIGIEWYIFNCGIFETSILKNIKKITKVIIFTTLFFEIIGAIIYKFLSHIFDLKLSIVDSFFISVNMFCNSGFIANKSILGDLYSNSYFLITSTILTIAGGLGFLFFFEFFSNFFKEKSFFVYPQEKNFFNFSLTTKIALKVYFYSSLIAFIFYFFFYNESLSFLFFSKILFLSFSMKSLGLTPYKNIFNPFLSIFTILYNFIGTAPLGTGAGLKTSVTGLIFLSIKSFLKNDTSVIIQKRVIPWNIIAYSYATLFFIINFSFLGSFFLSNLVGNNLPFASIFSDTLSVFLGNGFIFNIPTSWSFLIKLTFILLMLFGKILLIFLGLPAPKRNDEAIIYPKENIAIF